VQIAEDTVAVSTEEDLRQRAEQQLQALLEPALQVAYRQLGDCAIGSSASGLSRWGNPVKTIGFRTH